MSSSYDTIVEKNAGFWGESVLSLCMAVVFSGGAYRRTTLLSKMKDAKTDEHTQAAYEQVLQTIGAARRQEWRSNERVCVNPLSTALST